MSGPASASATVSCIFHCSQAIQMFAQFLLLLLGCGLQTRVGRVGMPAAVEWHPAAALQEVPASLGTADACLLPYSCMVPGCYISPPCTRASKSSRIRLLRQHCPTATQQDSIVFWEIPTGFRAALGFSCEAFVRYWPTACLCADTFQNQWRYRPFFW